MRLIISARDEPEQNRRELSIDGDDETPGQARANEVSFIRDERTCPTTWPVQREKRMGEKEGRHLRLSFIRYEPTRVRRIQRIYR